MTNNAIANKTPIKQTARKRPIKKSFFSSKNSSLPPKKNTAATNPRKPLNIITMVRFINSHILKNSLFYKMAHAKIPIFLIDVEIPIFIEQAHA
jgi:hypothetical protein